jgi:hypothetical protein
VTGELITQPSWLQRHERLIIVALVLLAGGWLINHWLNDSAAKDSAQSAVAMQQVESQKSANVQLAAAVTQSTQQYQALVTTLTQQNMALEQSIATRNTGLKTQQVADKSLPLPQIASRWKTLVTLEPNDLVPDSVGGISITDAGARATVGQLEQIPVLQSNLVSVQSVSDNRQLQLDSSSTLAASQTLEIAGLKSLNSDQDLACKKQVSSLKAASRKSKLNWFLRGLGVGAGVGAYVAVHLL